jgi:hypothetical protein
MDASVKQKPFGSLELKLRKPLFSLFLPILQTGFQVEVASGINIRDLLCENFKIDVDYLEDRIKTIFLDGKPVDDVCTALLKDGSVVALSAALPGLVGSTFRRGGVLAAFRNDITHREDVTAAGNSDRGRVKVKLFNLLAGELGPGFLKRGVWVRPDDVRHLLKDHEETLQAAVASFKLDAREVSPVMLASVEWPKNDNTILLKVSVRHQPV